MILAELTSLHVGHSGRRNTKWIEHGVIVYAPLRVSRKPILVEQVPGLRFLGLLWRILVSLGLSSSVYELSMLRVL